MNIKKIRKAVGAVIIQRDEILLVHKIKNIDYDTNGKGHWDLPKGGVQDTDKSLESAILRELYEETGTNKYKIIKKIDTKICFNFKNNNSYNSQETTMFDIEYFGDRTELFSRDDEIDEVQFIKINKLNENILLKETQDFLTKENIVK